MPAAAAHQGAIHDRAELVAHARNTIARGSKSFAAASLLFDRVTRERVWLLYAWCRAADDLADAQDMGGELGDQAHAADRLATIRSRTALALAGKPTGDASFDGLGVVARECGLTADMCDDVVAGFALDAADWQPRTEADMLQYCYHVAGAVGVMMAKVMGVSNPDTRDNGALAADTLAADTLDRACDLGIAFQLANIVRDVWEDDAAGRCYLPVEWMVEADITPGEHMKPIYRPELVAMVHDACVMARAYEASARIGAARLPIRSRWAILAATGIYGSIARKVEKAGIHGWDHRAFTTRFEKLRHVFGAAAACLRAPPASCVEDARARPLTRRDFEARARKVAQNPGRT